MENELCNGMICFKENSIEQIELKKFRFFYINIFRNQYPYRPLLLSEFGRITWNSFHKMCAYFSSKPSQTEKDLIQKMFQGFGYFFPCKNCKTELIQQMKQFPIVVTNNIELSKWFLNQHNQINEKLKKKKIQETNIIQYYSI